MANLYQGAYRQTLDDNSDIEALEAERDRMIALREQGIAPTGDKDLDTEMGQAPRDAEDATFKKRYSDLRTHMNRVQAEHKRELEEVKRQLENNTRQGIKLPKSEDEINAWMQEFPDVAKIVQSIAMRAVNEKEAEYNKRFEEVEKLKAQSAAEKAYAQLMRAHPDFDEIRAEDDFHDWVSTKSKQIRYALYEQNTDWQSAAEAISLFKLETGWGKPKKKPVDSRDAAEGAPRGSRVEVGQGKSEGKKIWYEDDIGRMRPKEFELYETEIEQARLEGRIRPGRGTAAVI